MTILHLTILVSEALYDLPTDLATLARLLIVSLWPLIDILYYLMSKRFKAMFAYFLPLYVLLLNLVTTWFYIERVKA